jgi:hypothetical protein
MVGVVSAQARKLEDVRNRHGRDVRVETHFDISIVGLRITSQSPVSHKGAATPLNLLLLGLLVVHVGCF